MGQKYNPATGQWEDSTDTSTGGDPTVPVSPAPLQLPSPQPDVVPRNQLPSGPTIQQSDSGGTLNTSPYYTPPPPGQNASAPRPSVDASVVYTDQQGNAYDPPSLSTAWNTPGFRNDPANARVGDILAQYGYGGPSAAAPAAASAAGGGGGGAAGGPATLPGNPFNDQVRKIIMDRLAQAGTPVDPNSPEIAATMSAASDAGTRASDAERTALAERLYAQGGGLNTDAVTRQIQQSGEKQAGTLSTLKASLLTNQYNQKRQELQALLSLAVQSGDAESARQAQLAMANLDAAIRREGLGINLAEFGATLNQNASLAGLRG